MRLRVFAVTLFAFAIAISVAAGTARGASAPTPAGSGAHGPALAAPDGPGANVTLFDNNNNDSGIGIVSQNFEADNAAYDAEGADHFTVPAGHIWTVKEVIVTGVYFNGSGPADSENIRFYTNLSNLPGDAQKMYLGVFGADNGFGSFDITLPTAATFSGGPSGSSGRTYWMSVVANMNFDPAGEWGWESSLNSTGFDDVWRNPGDGFGTGCTSFTPEPNCIPDGQGPSKMFALKGVNKVTT
jgi:hypothetical protein